jgi:hypothetical protein
MPHERSEFFYPHQPDSFCGEGMSEVVESDVMEGFASVGSVRASRGEGVEVLFEFGAREAIDGGVAALLEEGEKGGFVGADCTL